MKSADIDNLPTKENYETLVNNLREEFQKTLRQELINVLRPASEVILDDLDVQMLLKVSRRHTLFLRDEKKIKFSRPIPKGRVYYTLKDVLDFIESGRNE
jgi:hypothetical protein